MDLFFIVNNKKISANQRRGRGALSYNITSHNIQIKPECFSRKYFNFSQISNQKLLMLENGENTPCPDVWGQNCIIIRPNDIV
jgi:hypothetical protein